jgi:hypothetical protein
MSPENQRLISPPKPPQTNLVPRLKQHWKVGEVFFASGGTSSGEVFVDDGIDDDESSPMLNAVRLDQREGPTVSATGWCNGDTERQDGRRTVKPAGALGQMPHGRWQVYVESGGPSGIVHSRAEPWVAQVFQRDDGVHIGMSTFRPTAAVYDGTNEELVLRLIAMLEGTRTIRKATNRGVVSHLVQNDRRVDICAMLSSVGLSVSNTNPAAFSPMHQWEDTTEQYTATRERTSLVDLTR